MATRKTTPPVDPENDWHDVAPEDDWKDVPAGAPAPGPAAPAPTAAPSPQPQGGGSPGQPSLFDKAKLAASLGLDAVLKNPAANLAARVVLNPYPNTHLFGGRPPQNLGDWMGVGSNVLNEAYGTGRASALAGPEAVPFGAGAGAVHALTQPPSQHPLTDIGATLFGSGLTEIPGLNRFVRPALGVAGTLFGGWAGSEGDKAMGITHETPWGTIGLYSAAAGAAGILGAFASDASAAKQAADRVKASTGVDVPLSVPQATGRFQSLWDMFGQGSQAAKDLAKAQDPAYRSAFQKLAGAPLDQIALDDIASTGKMLHSDVIGEYARNWKAANKNLVSSEVPIPNALEATGYNLTNTETKLVDPATVDWTDFQSKMGLTNSEREAIFDSIDTSPSDFVAQLVPGTGANRMKGLFALRGFMKILNNSGMQDRAAKLGQAAIQQQMDATFKQPVVNGADFAKRITNASQHLEAILTSDQVDALDNLAEVARDANPVKTGMEKTTQGQRSGSYLFNKIVFASTSVLGMAALGGHLGGANAAAILIGGAGGAAMVVPTSTLIGRVLADPKMGDLLISASKGSQGAISALMRSFYQSTTNKGKPEAPAPGSLASRTFGNLFR